MSRGAGQIMRRLLGMVVLTDEELGGALGYGALAAAVYEVETPSKAQVSAIARAARSLERDGLVEIYAWETDRRQKVVAPSPLLALAAHLVAEADLVPETESWLKRVSLTIEVIKDLAGMGVISVQSSSGPVDPNKRALTIDAPMRKIGEVLDEHPELRDEST